MCLFAKRCSSLAVGLSRLHDKSLVDVGDHTTTSDSGFDEGVKLFVATDSELQVSGRDSLDLEVLAGVARQLEHFGGQVFQDSRSVNSGGCTNATAGVHSGLKHSVDSANGELENQLMG